MFDSIDFYEVIPNRFFSGSDDESNIYAEY